MIKKAIIISIVALFWACGHMPQIRYYRLQVPPGKDGSEKSTGQPLYIMPVQSAPIYQQEKMIYQLSPYEIRFDHYRRWVEPPVKLLRRKALEYFRSTGVFSMTTDRPPLDDDFWVLEIDLMDLKEVVDDQNRSVVFHLRARFASQAEQQHIWQGMIEKRQKIQKPGGDGTAHATSLAIENAFDELLDHFLQSIGTR
ncbi:hypothetical protein GF407_09465 [candidate division KSB1 bacterium]|nr:hypothetical protein [candidate division KSB1 bacterium]